MYFIKCSWMSINPKKKKWDRSISTLDAWLNLLRKFSITANTASHGRWMDTNKSDIAKRVLFTLVKINKKPGAGLYEKNNEQIYL